MLVGVVKPSPKFQRQRPRLQLRQDALASVAALRVIHLPIALGRISFADLTTRSVWTGRQNQLLDRTAALLMVLAQTKRNTISLVIRL